MRAITLSYLLNEFLIPEFKLWNLIFWKDAFLLGNFLASSENLSGSV
jgi:hypothetical protein